MGSSEIGVVKAICQTGTYSVPVDSMSHFKVCAFLMVQVACSEEQVVVRTPCRHWVARILISSSPPLDKPQRRLQDLACRMWRTAWQLPQHLAGQETWRRPSALLSAAWPLQILTGLMSQRYIFIHAMAAVQTSACPRNCHAAVQCICEWHFCTTVLLNSFVSHNRLRACEVDAHSH